MKLLHSIPRGFEYEYAVTVPAEAVAERRHVVHLALAALHRLGYTAAVPWSTADEVGNLGYEQSLAHAWTLSEGPYPLAYNGMRLYEDAMHLEVSTPLYADPLDAVVYSLAGEYLVHQSMQHLHKDGLSEVRAYKNNVSTRPARGGYESVAYGAHSNLALRRCAGTRERWDMLRQAIIPYVVARVPLIGGGDVIPVVRTREDWLTACSSGVITGPELAFAISPRAGFIKHMVTHDTMVDRGLINLRDEPLADATRWWRYHDINHESLRCPFQIYVRDVAQALVFAAFDRGLLDDAPLLKNPMESILRVSLDGEGMAWQVDLRGGRRVDAVADLLEGFYLQRVGELVDREGDAEDRAAFEVLAWTVRRLAERDLGALEWGLDWVTKRRLIEEYGVHAQVAAALCNQFSYIDSGVEWYLDRPVDESLRDSLFEPDLAVGFAIERLPVGERGLPALVQTALKEPPSHTREASRLSLLRRFESDVVRAGWERLYFRDGRVVVFGDPTGAEAVG